MVRGQIDELFASGRPVGEVIEEVARLGAQLLLQMALEAEVDEFLGRTRYERATGGDGVRAGFRNGYSPVTVKTTSGAVALSRPKVRGTTEKFASRLFGARVCRSNALETLVIASFVRGLSTRDVEATLEEVLGQDGAVSRSTVSRICEQITAEYQRWTARPLTEVELDYLFLDASVFRMHPGADGEPLLAGWGVDRSGKPVFVGIGAAGTESTDAWTEFLTDLAKRGLRAPLLVISDGAPGLIAACESVWPGSYRQRCLIHKARNVAAKLPEETRAEVIAEYWAIFDVDTLVTPDETGRVLTPGPELVTVVQARIDRFADKYQGLYPSAVKSLLTDREQATSYLHFPVGHHKRVRHSNLIERTFGESRRRVKVIGRFPGETSCLSLVWAVLDRACSGWKGLATSPAITLELDRLRRRLFGPPAHLTHPATTPAAAAA
jgi:transposase-like protein